MASNPPPPPLPPHDGAAAPAAPPPPVPHGATEPYAGTAAPIGSLSGTATLATAAQVALGITVIIGFLNRIQASDSGAAAILFWFANLGTIASGVLVIIWLYRIVANSQALGRTPSLSPILAVFGWLIFPFFWFLPAMQLNEQWKLNTPDPDQPSRTNWKIWAWFVCGPIYLTVMVVAGGMVFFSMMSDISTIDPDNETQIEEIAADATANLTGWTYALGFVQVVAGVLFILIIRELTARQHARIAATRR